MSKYELESEISSLAILKFNIGCSYWGGYAGILYASVAYVVLATMLLLLAGGFLPGFIGFIAVMVAFFSSLVIGAVSILVVNVLNFGLRNYFDTRTVVSVIGGVTGYIPLSVPFLIGNSTDAWELLFYWIAGPTTAMFFGTLGAMWFLESYLGSHHQRDKASLAERLGARNTQFNIRQIMVLTLYVALVFALTQLIERKTDFLLTAIYWVCVQAITIWVLRKTICRSNSLATGVS